MQLRLVPGFAASALLFGALLVGTGLADAAGASVHDVTSSCAGLQGATGKGFQDDTAEIQCHVDAASAAGGGAVYFPKGDYKISRYISVSGDRLTLYGDGVGSQIRSARNDHTIFSVHGRKHVVFRDLSVRQTGNPPDPDFSVGFSIGGNAEDILFENVRSYGFDVGIQSSPEPGSVATHLTLRDVWIERSEGNGIEIFNTENIRIYNARVGLSGNTGLKIGQGVQDWEIHGGRFWGNARVGISTHGGGDRWLIAGSEIEGNQGSGLLIKAAAATTSEDDPSTEGTIVGVIAEGNTGSGLDLFIGTPSRDPLPNHVSVLGGSFSRNQDSGIRIGNGRNVSLVGVVVKENEDYGIVVREDSFDVSIVSALVSGNGVSSPSAPFLYSGITIAGDRVRVIGTQVNGINQDASVGAPVGTSHHKFGVEIGSTASDVLVEGCVLRNSDVAAIGGTLGGAILRDNVGFVTQRTGTATVPFDQSYVRVSHQMPDLPAAQEISISPLSGWGSATQFHVGNITSASFDILLDRAPGQPVSFRWDVDMTGT